MCMHSEMVIFDAVNNGLPPQMRAAGADGVGFPFYGDRKMKKKMRCSNSVLWF